MAVLITVGLLVLARSSSTAFEPPACNQNCPEFNLYESPDSPLQFSIYRVANKSNEKHAQATYRHQYQIVLTQNGSILSVFDQHAHAHHFRKMSENYFKPLTGASGTLRQVDKQLVWTTQAGTQNFFDGSRLKRVVDTTKHTLLMQYRQDKLDAIIDDHGKRIKLNYDQNRLIAVRKPDGFTVPLEIDLRVFTTRVEHECLPGDVISAEPEIDTPDTPNAPDDNTDEALSQADGDPSSACDLASTDPHTFQPVEQTSVQVNAIDARPESCQSYFVAYYGTLRGFEIEAGLAGHPPYSTMLSTIRTYPVIDFIDGENLYVVHSRDLGSQSYDPALHPDALLNSLLTDGEEIQQNFLDPINEHGHISAHELGQSTTIFADEVGSITLQLVIRDGIASPDHWRQIELARAELLRRYGIVLEVVIIP